MENRLPVRHCHYYFTHGSHILQVSYMLFHWDLLKYHLHKVEDTLYKLFGELLSSDSVIFKQMLVSGPDSAVSNEGFSDDNPIHIRDLKSQVFDMFVEHNFGRSVS